MGNRWGEALKEQYNSNIGVARGVRCLPCMGLVARRRSSVVGVGDLAL